jgi:hypothetical protein
MSTLFGAVLLAALTLAQSTVQLDAHLPATTTHVTSDTTVAIRHACGAYHLLRSARVGNGLAVVRCIAPRTREVVVQSLLDVPRVCGGYANIDHTDVFEDGSVLAHCRLTKTTAQAR